MNARTATDRGSLPFDQTKAGGLPCPFCRRGKLVRDGILDGHVYADKCSRPWYVCEACEEEMDGDRATQRLPETEEIHTAQKRSRARIRGYRVVETASGWAVERPSDQARAEFLDREDAAEALANLGRVNVTEEDYLWQERA